jgi:hypothetical protein
MLTFTKGIGCIFAVRGKETIGMMYLLNSNIVFAPAKNVASITLGELKEIVEKIKELL